MAATLAWNSVQTGNRLGGLIFNDSTHFEFRPAPGKRGVLPFLQQLAETANYLKKKDEKSSPCSMEGAIDNLKRVAPVGSLIFVLSDFRQFSHKDRDSLIQLAKHCDLRLCFFYDPLEVSLSKNGLYPVTDGEQRLNLNTGDKKALEQYRQQFVERKNQVASLSHYRHVQFMECKTDEDYFNLLR
jgi:uncharacterized protein (DUF58 family)